MRLARKAVESHLDGTVLRPPEDYSQSSGVFVTLNYKTKNNEERLRGCVGYPYPYKGLSSSVIDAAIAAATEDPRFPPVSKSELANLLFEISVLSTPVELTCERSRLHDNIVIGRDGLILRWKHGSGLLLPQVPVELGWDANEFLSNLCFKAGAMLDALLEKSSSVYTFQAIVFKELEPLGPISRISF